MGGKNQVFMAEIQIRPSLKDETITYDEGTQPQKIIYLNKPKEK